MFLKQKEESFEMVGFIRFFDCPYKSEHDRIKRLKKQLDSKGIEYIDVVHKNSTLWSTSFDVQVKKISKKINKNDDVVFDLTL